MYTETIRQLTIGRVNVTIEAVNHCEGSHWFDELYTESEHIAGTTITTPSWVTQGFDNRHWIGQTTPAELTKCYAKQGRKNPSAEAYASLQKELAHYMLASDCSLRCTVTMNGIELASVYGIGFDWSEELEESFSDLAAEVMKENGIDFIKQALQEARETRDSLA